MPASGDPDRICTIRIELTGSEPLIWREVEAPTWITLDDLHQIIQIVMGWENEHLFEFTIAKQSHVPLNEFNACFGRTIDSGDTILGDILRPRRTTFRYMYDFGDSWDHQVIVTKIRLPEAGVTYPRYLGGERNGPPEDCGGLYRFYEGLEAIARHDDSDEAYWWTDGYDPDYVEVEGIGDALRALAGRLRKQARRKKSKAAAMRPLRDDTIMADKIAMMVNAFRAATPARRASSAGKK